MTLEQVATSMRKRMPWPIGRLILEENEVPRGRGWDNTVAKLADLNGEGDNTQETLTESLRQHLLCGEKFTTFYTVRRALRERLAERLLSSDIEESPASLKYPLLLDDDELERESPRTRLVAVEPVEGGLNAVFSSVRVNVIREPIGEDVFPEGMPDELDQYYELIGIKHSKSQAIDVIYVPSDQRHVDLRIDFPPGSTSDHIEVARERLRQIINTAIGSEVLTTPINLWPLIDFMYHSPQEGKVVELAFGTTTRSLKHEKMRRGAADLRKESYHRGGKAALGTAIEPHRISIEYGRGIAAGLISRPEVTLAGTAHMAASGSPVLTGATIRKCSSVDDFQFVRGRLRHFLRQNAPDEA